jgi:hypothetical protein
MVSATYLLLQALPDNRSCTGGICGGTRSGQTTAQHEGELSSSLHLPTSAILEPDGSPLFLYPADSDFEEMCSSDIGLVEPKEPSEI